MKRRRKNESVAWFPGIEPERAMQVDAALQQVTHDLLRGLVSAFPDLDQTDLANAAGKAEKALAGALAAMLSPGSAEEPDDEPELEDEPEDDVASPEFPPDSEVGETLARRILRQVSEAEDFERRYNWVEIATVIRKMFNPAVESQLKKILFPTGKQESPQGYDVKAALRVLGINGAQISDFIARLEKE